MSEQRQQRTEQNDRDRNTGDVAADPKGALTLSQANIFDGLMKTMVCTRVTGRSKMRRWLLNSFCCSQIVVCCEVILFDVDKIQSTM